MKKKSQDTSCCKANIAVRITRLCKALICCGLLAIANPAQVSAQKIVSLTTTDTTKINTSVRLAMDRYVELLNILCDPSNDVADHANYITAKFETFKTFANKTFNVESGLNSSNKMADQEILIYLQNFYHVYKPSKDKLISYKIVEIKPVQKSADYKLSLVLLYQESYNGEYSVDGSTWQKYVASQDRVAEFVINKVDGKWQAYICGLSFWDRNKVYDVSNSLPVVSGAQETSAEQDVTTGKSESYYDMLMSRGARAMADSRYADAFRAYKEATASKVNGKEAEKKVIEVKGKVRASGKMDVEAFLFRELERTAKSYELRHDYAEAKRCYEYAYDCQPIKAEIPKLIALLSDKISREDKAADLYNKGLYDDAIKEYQKIIGGDNGNPNLWVGWAKCYAKMNVNKEAESRFDQALTLDPTNAETYYWQGKYYQEKKDPSYDKAYNCFASYVVRTEDKADTTKLNPVYSLMSFCKGIESFNARKYPQAIDSFNYALKYSPDFANAYYYIGRCYFATDKANAVKNFEQAVKLSPAFAEAHYWLGKTYSTDYSDKKNNEKAISEIGIALKYEPANSQWNFDLASIILSRKVDKESLTDAVKYYSNCITNAPLSLKAPALRKRGQCHQKLEDRNNALKDYAEYRRLCDESHMPIDPLLQKDISALDGGK